MISISDKNVRTTHYPDELRPEKTKDKIDDIIAQAPEHSINSIYNSDEVREKLKAIYGNKCAYCESIPFGSSAFRVDHYRPKKHVKELAKEDHYGYFWLSLEWTNLIQSCESCNSKKSNHFPLKSEDGRINAILKDVNIVQEASRDFRTSLLSSESRLLLHPELDPVEKHLLFLPNGKVKEKDGSEMGSTSCRLYNLNRDGLVWLRKKKIDQIYFEIIGILNDYEDNGADGYALPFLQHDLTNLFRTILGAQDEGEAYSRLGYYMFHHFEQFYIDRLPDELDEHKALIKEFYNSLLK
ncbi:MAG: hypothetical protein HEP71_03190 [Roseivirga sp.]|nr:hypothetical protein [Roseivirga sp.]